MTVLVTGGAGYIGSATVAALLRAGESVVVLDSLEPGLGFKESIPAGVPLYEGQVGDSTLVRSLVKKERIRAVIHCAALISVPESFRYPERYQEVNAEQTGRLVDAAASSGVDQFVFASSAAVYGSPGLAPISEELPLHPGSPYGDSKMKAESKFWPSGSAVLRYFNTAGADLEAGLGNHKKQPQHLIARAVLAALGLIPQLEIFGTDYPTSDGSGQRDYVHVCDLARANVLALQAVRRRGSFIANIGSGHAISNFEVVRAVKSISRIDVPVVYADRRPGDPASSVADIRIAREILWWKPMPKMKNLRRIVRDELLWQAHLHHIQLPEGV